LKKKPPVIKYGMNEVVNLIERQKAILVVIAHDVEPIDLVIYLPALCKKLDVPYCIVKSKARLGKLVHLKTTTTICLTEVNKEDKTDFDNLCQIIKTSFNDKFAQINRKWGGGKISRRSQHQRDKIKQ